MYTRSSYVHLMLCCTYEDKAIECIGSKQHSALFASVCVVIGPRESLFARL